MSDFDQRLPSGWRVWSENSTPVSDGNDASDPRWIRELDQISGTGPKKTRSVPVKLLAPLLLEAQRRNSSWLNDFADDVVVIDADLHDVLLAYQKLQQDSPSLFERGDSRGAAA